MSRIHQSVWIPGWRAKRHAAARAHAQGCDACRAVADDLDLIQVAAPTLSVADPEPSAQASGPALRAQLAAEGLIHDNLPVDSALAGKLNWWEGFFALLPRPALAGGYLAFLVAVAIGSRIQRAVGHPAHLSGQRGFR